MKNKFAVLGSITFVVVCGLWIGLSGGIKNPSKTEPDAKIVKKAPFIDRSLASVPLTPYNKPEAKRLPAAALDEKTIKLAEKRVTELYAKFNKLPTAKQDGKQLMIDLNKIAFEALFGKNHPKMAAYIQAYTEMIGQKQGYDLQVMSGTMKMDEYFNAMDKTLADFRATQEKNLTDAEFERLFAVPKGTNLADLVGLNMEAYAEFKAATGNPGIEDGPVPTSILNPGTPDKNGLTKAQLKPEYTAQAKQAQSDTLYGYAKSVNLVKDRADFDEKMKSVQQGPAPTATE